MKQKAIGLITVAYFIVFGSLSAGLSYAQDAPAAEVQAPASVEAPVPPLPERLLRPRCVDNEPKATSDPDVVIIPLHDLDGDDLERFASSLDVRVYPDRSGKNAVLSGSEEAIAKVQEFVNLFNVPPNPEKNIMLTFYVVTTAPENSGPGRQLDPPIMDQIRELLGNTMGISQFSVWDTLFLLTRDNDTAESSGFLPPAGEKEENNPLPTFFKMKIGSVKVITTGEEPSRIALDDLVCSVEVDVVRGMGPTNQQRGISRQEIGFKSNLNIREGQLEILNKTSISSKGDSIILLVSAKVSSD